LSHQLFKVDAAKRNREGTLRLTDRRDNHLFKERRTYHRCRIAGVLDGAGCAKDIVGLDAAALAG
jgi:hypothetical protein